MNEEFLKCDSYDEKTDTRVSVMIDEKGEEKEGEATELISMQVEEASGFVILGDVAVFTA